MPDIEPARLWSDLMVMGAIGGTPNGGSFRPALSDADRQGRALFIHWAQEAGLSVSVDQIGNIFARREGTQPDAAPVMVGSHLDTQMPGGKFDGVLGVLAGLELCRALDRDKVETRHPIEVVNWTNEEGARFQPGVMGSGCFCGTLALDQVLERRDSDDIRLADALRGMAGPALVGGRVPHCYLELHIEQGPELERAAIDIAMVSRTSNMASGYITIRGANAHSQTEPMSRRRNALSGAARLILAIDAIGAAMEPEGMVSASCIDNWPNNRVNIPHLTQLSYAIVHNTAEGRAQIMAQINDAVAQVSAQTGLDIDVEHRHFREAFDFSPDLRALGVDLAQKRGLTATQLPTLTAHDALALHGICPTALIFVPCRDGVSHSEAEWCTPAHAAQGAQLLLDLALSQAG
ncbi:hypothetical protein BFP70_15960 [Thioclava sp. SK-1]|uniref:M20 family metallo-hydrolase n=1 Tax=Thioclava sp. SK-1 TaxID=1889770 RepID=UPI000826FF71|nr:M20 family metallo-hydrolase [Thioclava sp. SK-1]OCX60964.1 hypothetical protein BFP70_15960 [Thioclava sp. SK-1]